MIVSSYAVPRDEARVVITTEDATTQPAHISPQADTTQPVGLTVDLRVAKKTRQRFVSRVTRLDEQGSISEVIEGYVRRWRRWVTSGLDVWATQLRVFDDALSEPSRGPRVPVWKSSAACGGEEKG